MSLLVGLFIFYVIFMAVIAQSKYSIRLYNTQDKKDNRLTLLHVLTRRIYLSACVVLISMCFISFSVFYNEIFLILNILIGLFNLKAFEGFVTQSGKNTEEGGKGVKDGKSR